MVPLDPGTTPSTKDEQQLSWIKGLWTSAGKYFSGQSPERRMIVALAVVAVLVTQFVLPEWKRSNDIAEKVVNQITTPQPFEEYYLSVTSDSWSLPVLRPEWEVVGIQTRVVNSLSTTPTWTTLTVPFTNSPITFSGMAQIQARVSVRLKLTGEIRVQRLYSEWFTR